MKSGCRERYLSCQSLLLKAGLLLGGLDMKKGVEFSYIVTSEAKAKGGRFTTLVGGFVKYSLK